MWRKCNEPTDHRTLVTAEFEAQVHFPSPLFGDVIKLHNQHLGKLQNLRRLISRHSEELARLIKTFPGTETLDKDVIRDTFALGIGPREPVADGEIFKPWAQRWSGTWSNGTPQFHVWDRTQYWNGQWIQAVTQSEIEFSVSGNVEAMFLRNQVDLGINVYTAETGITGWVSKRQHGRLELPHIGYLVDARTLVWITQPQDPDHLFQGDPTWFVFLETVDSRTDAKRYSIYGHMVVIESGLRWDAERRGQHCGNYEVQRAHGGA